MRGDEIEPSAGPREERWLRLLLLACVCVALTLGALKLFGQKAHPPDFALSYWNRFEGYVSIDNFSKRADLIRRCMIGEEGAHDALLGLVRRDGHPTSFAVPIAIALLAPLTGSIPIAFALLSALALVVNVWLSMRIAARAVGDRAGSTAPVLVGVLVASHVLTMRTAAQLYLDPFVTVFALASVLASIRHADNPGVGGLVWILMFQLLGLLTKVSYLPFLLGPALVLLACRPEQRRLWLGHGLLLAVVPLLLVILIVGSMLGVRAGGADAEHLFASWNLSARQLRHFAFEMLLLFQAFPLLLLHRGARTRLASALLGLAALYTLSMWTFNLPAVPRLYLPALYFFVVGLAGPADRLFGGRFGRLLLGGYCAANLAAGAYGVLGAWSLL